MNLTDIHCHILPYVDDGSESLDESKELMQMQYEQGVRIVCATPHLRTGMFESTDEEIKKRFIQLQQLNEEDGSRLKLFLSREYYCDDRFLKRAENHLLIPYGKSNTVLVEFSSRHTADNIIYTIQCLKNAGYSTLVAHVHRYPDVISDIGNIEDIINAGGKIQVNAEAILGGEGFKVKHAVRKLIKEQMVHVVASDCHDVYDRVPRLDECEKWLESKAGAAYTKKIMFDNPIHILAGE